MKFYLILLCALMLTSCKLLNIKMADRGESKTTRVESNDRTTNKDKTLVSKSFGVIVASGLAHSISSVHFFKQLQNYDLNIKAFSGVGWGAVPAAIYANNLKPNELDWQLHKLKVHSVNKKNIFGKIKNEIDKKSHLKYLKQVFSVKHIDSFKAPFSCTTYQESEIKVVDSGEASSNINECSLSVVSLNEIDQKSFIRQSYLRLFEAFLSSNINNFILITHSDFKKYNIDFQQLFAEYTSNKRLAFEVKLHEIIIDTAYIENRMGFDQVDKILKQKPDDLKPKMDSL